MDVKPQAEIERKASLHFIDHNAAIKTVTNSEYVFLLRRTSAIGSQVHYPTPARPARMAIPTNKTPTDVTKAMTQPAAISSNSFSVVMA